MQASTAPEEQLQHCLELFRSTFNASPLFGARAPCCLVLAGEQSMKQHGMALTVALECGATAVGTLSFTNGCTVVLESGGVRRSCSFDAGPTMHPAPDGEWRNNVAGVVAQYHDTLPSNAPAGVNVAIVSDVPSRMGRASWAAVQAALACLLEAAYDVHLPPGSRAQRCERAEVEYSGHPAACAAHLAAASAVANYAQLLDCTRREASLVPLEGERVSVMLIACDGADSDPRSSQRWKLSPDSPGRVQELERALQRGDLEAAGRLMSQCDHQLAAHVDALTRAVRGTDGVFGCRPALWSGQVEIIALVRTDSVQQLRRALAEQHGIDGSRVYTSVAAQGTQLLELPSRLPLALRALDALDSARARLARRLLPVREHWVAWGGAALVALAAGGAVWAASSRRSAAQPALVRWR